MSTFVVTGAFGYSGRYIAERLLADGHAVRTLTLPASPQPAARTSRCPTAGLRRRARPRRSLTGVDALFNTYWVRFNHRTSRSPRRSRTRDACSPPPTAGVRRIVHVSITNPSEDSPFEYFRGKARLERALRESGVSYAILRPAVLFGGEDILINNIAWMLRQLPVFGVFGDGHYRVQPIHVDDLAALAVREARGHENVIVDAIGPETFTYRELVRTIGSAIDVWRPLLRVPPWLGLLSARALQPLLGDVLITREEIGGTDGGAARYGLPARRDPAAHRVGARSRGHAGPPLRERARPPPRSRQGLSQHVGRAGPAGTLPATQRGDGTRKAMCLAKGGAATGQDVDMGVPCRGKLFRRMEAI